MKQQNKMLVFGVVGINHNNASIEIREKIATPTTRYQQIYEKLRKATNISDILILSTCNRLEIYYLAKEDIGEELLTNYFQILSIVLPKTVHYQFTNEQALRQLWAVSAGLDSMIIGETQILGQIKEAAKISDSIIKNSPLFNRIFESANQVAKRIRSETSITRNSVSIGKVAVELAKEILGDLSNHSVILVGAGDVAEMTLNYLKPLGVNKLTVCNRTIKRAVGIAQKHRATIIPFESLSEAIIESDVVISSIEINKPLIKYDTILNIMKKRRFRPLFLMDLGVPRNIDEDIKKIDNCYLYNIDNLQKVSKNNHLNRNKEAIRGWEIIDSMLPQFKNWQLMFNNRVNITKFRNDFQAKFTNEIINYVHQLPIESPEIKQKVIKKINQSVNKLLHSPTKFIYSNQSPEENIELIYQIFELQDQKLAKNKEKVISINSVKKIKARN